MKSLKTSLLVGALSILTVSAHAEEHDHHHHMDHNGHHHAGHAGHNHVAPLAVMGGHVHDKGEWMLSYRYMRMDMEGNRDGTDSLSPEEIVTNFSNPNAPPANLRVVPTEMIMDMHMVGAMYAPTDWLTLMAMGMYIEKEMDHITFQGMAGTTRLGEFTTKSTGIGDTKVSGLFKIYDQGNHTIHLNAGLSLPTGSIDEEDDVLTPMNTRETLRMPYAMQLGTGTFDALPGITYNGHSGNWGWGAQYMGEIRLESENDEGYAWGDKHTLTAWGGYQANEWLSVQGNVRAHTQSEIDGRDPLIAAPVQTADPDNFGGETIALGGGFQIKPTMAELRNVTFGAEISIPVYQNLNGPQMETDWIGTAGLRVTF
ncbi:MAG: transporter [Pseudomonadota bacterium]